MFTKSLGAFIAFVLLFSGMRSARAQGTAFTYQGSLTVLTNAANGQFDLAFSLFPNSTGTGAPAGAITNLDVPITNGLITTALDFGSNAFTGGNLWLQIGVRTNGDTGPFLYLFPLQPLTPAPYAIFAQNATGNLTGNGANLTNIPWSSIANKPTTISGYGITDALLLGSSNQLAQFAEPRTTNLDYLNSLPLNELGALPAGVQANEFRTPPMGYCSWPASSTSVNEYLLTNVINTMTSNGMVAAGYTYVNLDDGWAGARDTNGNIQPTLTNGTWYPQTPQQYVTNVFPHGMKYIADYAHSNGMKLGIYTVVGVKTCAGYTGSAGHISQDAATYASWGIDYIKMETCSGPATNDIVGWELCNEDNFAWARTQFEAVANAIQTNYRPMFINVSWWWDMQPFLASEFNSWRGAGDARGGYWNSMFHFDFLANFSYLTGPGHYVDPDTIMNYTFTTEGQARSVWAAYAMMSAPLIVATPNSFVDVATNAGMVSIDQDPLVMPAHTVGSSAWSNTWTTEDGKYQFPMGANQQVWVKKLGTASGPKKAVMLLNRDTNAATMTINWSDLGFAPGATAVVYDCFTNAYAGYFTNHYTTSVAGQDCVLLVITSGGSMPAAQIGETFLSDIGWLDNSTCASGLRTMFKDQSCGGGRPISINGVAYAKGFGTYSPSTLNIYLGGITGRFHSDYGFDDDCSPPSTGSFQVWGDGVKLFDSGVIGKGAPRTADIPIYNLTNLSLVTVPSVTGGNDTVDWGNTYVISTAAGDGENLTNLNAANLVGTVSDLLLSPNIARLNTNQTFTGVNVFNNNVGIGTNNPTQKLVVAGNIVATGTITGSSDRNLKENFAPVDSQQVLQRVVGMPILRWNYKADGGQIMHIGPMAQDFYAAFALGMDDRHISMVDADGVALASIQALNKKIEEKSAEIEALKKRLDEMEKLLSKRAGSESTNRQAR